MRVPADPLAPQAAEDAEAEDAQSAQRAAEDAQAAQRAADDAQARELYYRGDRRYAEGDYEAAVVAFEEAYRLSRRPALLFNLANAYERLGRYEQALDHLERYAAHAPAAQQDLVQKRIAALQARAERLQARAREVNPRQRQEPATSGTATQQPPRNPTPAGPDVSRREDAKAAPIVGYALLGTGALAVGAAVLFAVAKGNARDRADAGCAGADGSRLCLGSVEDDLDDERRYALFSDLSAGAGIAALLVGAWLVLDPLSDDEGGTEAALRLGPTLGGGRIDVFGRF